MARTSRRSRAAAASAAAATTSSKPTSSSSLATTSTTTKTTTRRGHGGSSSDVAMLARNLDLPADQVEAIMSCGGAGLPNSRSSRSSSAAAAAAAAKNNDGGGAMMTGAWADFMQDEGGDVATADSGGGSSRKRPRKEGESGDKADGEAGDDKASNDKDEEKDMVTVVQYSLPLLPPLVEEEDEETDKTKSPSTDNQDSDQESEASPSSKSKKKKKKSKEKPRFAKGGGILVQTGTMDAKIVGRKKPSSTASSSLARPCDLDEPTILCPSVFSSSQHKIAYIATSCTACHSIALDTHGVAWGWGRNEDSQLGLGSTSALSQCATIFCPRKLEGPWSASTAIVSAAAGKGHSILADEDGHAYAAGNNKVGQCAVNSSQEHVSSFRKCHVVLPPPSSSYEDMAAALKGKKNKKSKGARKKKEEEEAADVSMSVVDPPKLVHLSAGEQFTAALDSEGRLYTAGSSEYGQLGNGESGEYFVTANKTAFSTSTKFEVRALFVTRDESKDVSNCATPMDDKVPLEDSHEVRLSSICCGKNHTVAVEAPSVTIKQRRTNNGDDDDKNSHKTTTARPRRVFSWGCGNFGCLGHYAQADEYAPRLLTAFATPQFAAPATQPVKAVAGASCSMILTQQGHVYYWGRHRNVGEATMRPAVVEALANNGHVVCAVSGGSQAVVMGTTRGNTVSWGMGPYGELGYGTKGPKSSAKPKFVVALDKCIPTQIAVGYGHTLLLLQKEDEEDEAALKGLKEVEEEDLREYDDDQEALVKVMKKTTGGEDEEDTRESAEVATGSSSSSGKKRKK